MFDVRYLKPSLFELIESSKVLLDESQEFRSVAEAEILVWRLTTELYRAKIVSNMPGKSSNLS